MFPIDMATKDYDAKMIAQFDALIEEKHFPWKLEEILSKALPAGAPAGVLTEEGANSGCIRQVKKQEFRSVRRR